MNWASGIDEKGRPIINPEARYGITGKPALVTPGPLGGHNWQPMSFSPITGLVYIPAIETAFPYQAVDPKTYHAADRRVLEHRARSDRRLDPA